MSQLKVCRICLRTEAKMYHFNLYQLKYYYEEVTAVKVNDQDGLPQHFCYECATILNKFHKFKEKCYYGQKLLKEILWRGPITYEAIYKIDRKDSLLQSPIQTITFTDHIKTYITKHSQEINETYDDETKMMEKLENNYFSDASLTDEETEPVDFLHNEKIFEEEIILEEKKKELDSKMKETDTEIEDNAEKIEPDVLKDIQPYSPQALYVDSKKGVIDVKCEDFNNKKDRKSDSHWISSINKVLDKNHWKIYVLNEEEALKNFRAKAEDTKYVNATYKCHDCFKWFSKKDILDRHIQLRHVESLGPYECYFCRMRFKLGCYLRKHKRQHYNKFECLRCHLICPLETSAVLHDEYHSGITRKCTYCDEEFRHSSTYYTHLRTHRSEHVCTLCGASFVSKAGLRQHKRVKHVIADIESPDDDEEVNTYCDRCDIRFETRKAFEEHLFHSALHHDVESNASALKNRKVLGKKEQAKIAKRVRRPITVEDVFKISEEQKPRKKTRRKHKKPTTCHQCGKHFNTQAECWKHHLAEHPRTSFFGPNERYICEICGSSLAPGSVANHQNMHTRSKLFSCDTCGKQFHAIMGLKRHLVTHTGEKPYACSLCGKRFTQSNSMKLHYRTFHLKEPYPKRNRRKNKDEPKTKEFEGTNSEKDSEDSLPDLQPEMSRTEIEPVTGAIQNRPEENMHYLTLA